MAVLIPLGHVAELVSGLNMVIGMAMAHTLYKSPRKLWQCILTYALIFAVCIPLGEVLNVALPQFAEQRIAAFIGCSFIFGYLYLFPNIPLPQRIFNYFLAVDVMYVILLISRTAAMLLVGYFGLPGDGTFLVCYLLCGAGYCIVYKKWFRTAILQGLKSFQKNLISLTIFSMICYFGSLFISDVWAPWPALTLSAALPHLGLIVMNMAGYALAFRTMIMMGQRLTAESEAKLAQLQLTLAEKEYHATMESIEQVRRLRHDMDHHLSALATLISKEEWKEAQSYIENTAALLPRRVLSDQNVITCSFIEHYRALCEKEEIAFRAQVAYDEQVMPNLAHLGILLGNALQNAYDAARTARGDGRFIAFTGKRVQDHLVLSVRNGFGSPPDPQLKSTKGAGHGLGLSGMHSVVEEYHGYLETAWEDGVFKLDIVLPLVPRAAERPLAQEVIS